MSTQNSPKEYEVEEILEHEGSGNETMYRVKWVGFERCTWEPEENLENAPEKLKEYWHKHRSSRQYPWWLIRCGADKLALKEEIKREQNKHDSKNASWADRKYCERVIKHLNEALPYAPEPAQVPATPQTGRMSQPQSPETSEEETPIPSPEQPAQTPEQVPEEEPAFADNFDPFFVEPEWTTYWSEFPEDPRITDPFTGLPMEFMGEEDSQFVSFEVEF